MIPSRIFAALRVFALSLVLSVAARATVNSMMGVTISTSSTILGVTPCSAVMGQTVAAGGGGDPLLPYLLSEGFETPTTGYENSWTTSGAGTFSPATSTSGLSLGGAQCLRIQSSGTNDNLNASFTSGTTMYGHVLYRYASLGGATELLNLRASGSMRLRVTISGAGVLSITHGSITAAVTDAISANTSVHIWFEYQAASGGGGNGVGRVAWSTTTTRPTSGTKFQEVTNGNGTVGSAVNQIYLGNAANETHDIYFDNVWVDEAGYPQP